MLNTGTGKACHRNTAVHVKMFMVQNAHHVTKIHVCHVLKDTTRIPVVAVRKDIAKPSGFY